MSVSLSLARTPCQPADSARMCAMISAAPLHRLPPPCALSENNGELRSSVLVL